MPNSRLESFALVTAAKPASREAADPAYPLTWQIIAASTVVLGAGALHFVYAPLHIGEARGQGLFFLLLGFIQVGWGATVLRVSSPRSYLVGLTIATVMPAVLYVVTRFVAAPFSEEAEGIDMIGATTFAAEGLGAVLLAWHGIRQGVAWRNPTVSPGLLIVLLAFTGLLLAGVLFGVGQGLEAAVPWLGDGEDTGHH